MSTASIAGIGKANRQPDRNVGQFPTSGRLISALARKAKLLWASKVATELAIRTGMSVRSAERWLAGDRAMSGDAVVSLLQSDKGVAFLDALIEDMPDEAQRRWRREFDRAAERAEMQRRQEEIDRRTAANIRESEAL